MPKIKHRDSFLHYDVIGEGEPLLLIMGWGGNSLMWDPIMSPLVEKFKVITFDNRGVGRSSKLKEPYTMELFVDDTKAVLDEVKISKTHVFGVSMGGMIAQNLALTYPKMVNKLILGCTSPKLGVNIKHALDQETSPFFVRSFSPSDIKQLLSMIFSPNYVEKLMKDKEEFKKFFTFYAKYPPSWTSMKHQAAAIAEHDTLNRLNQIDHKTLIIAGKLDSLIPFRHSKKLKDSIPNSKLILYEDTGHGFWIEKPKETAKNVLKFL
ncbi:MAG: alpha/beta hydrolase [Candidatus Lokiarchaeota archaeon]|nr:alpha/beta hydrolase [Candidatus Lokiarchaeota archaeon]